MWLVGKSSELVVEVISNKVGKENTDKMSIYAKMGVIYYVLVDPYLYLYEERLNVFYLSEGQYKVADNFNFFMPEINLGILIWEGLFEAEKAPWARWCTKKGNVLYTDAEKSQIEAQRAEQERLRAEKLLAQLKALGLNPEE